jgi:lactate permease
LIALVPVVLLLTLLAVFRVSAWLAVLIGSIVTFALAIWVWKMPLDTGTKAYLYGSATGLWNVNWISGRRASSATVANRSQRRHRLKQPANTD